MTRPNRYDRLYQEVGKCILCHEHAVINPLLPDRFRFCWKPWREGPGPYKFIFVAMEPFLNCEDEVQPGGFNEPLRFAIYRFLFKPFEPRNFLITNMAKCSLAV